MKFKATHSVYRAAGILLVLILLLCLSASDILPPHAKALQKTVPTPTPVLVTTNAPASAPITYHVITRLNVAYGPLPDEVLDLCVPQDPATARPGILIIHGGGWVGGDKGFFDQFCSSLAVHGFVAATINYRLAPKYTWPAQLVDAQLAVRWLRSQANQLMLDPTRICGYGRSAGGQLAVFLGTLSSIHAGDEAGLLANEAPNVSCVVDLFGPTDLAHMLNTDYQRTLVQTLLGDATPGQNSAIYHDASPIFDVSSQSAPMLIVQGTDDTIVPPGQSWELEEKLALLHVPVQFISYEGGHSFGGLDLHKLNAIQDQIFAYLVAQEHP
jgi:acetyl esterase/lipase